jgi:acyl carrier protein
VIQLIRDELKWQGDVPEGELANYLDSIKRLSLVVAIEDHWQICLEPEDEQLIQTLDDLASVIDHIIHRENAA